MYDVLEEWVLKSLSLTGPQFLLVINEEVDPTASEVFPKVNI